MRTLLVFELTCDSFYHEHMQQESSVRAPRAAHESPCIVCLVGRRAELPRAKPKSSVAAMLEGPRGMLPLMALAELGLPVILGGGTCAWQHHLGGAASSGRRGSSRQLLESLQPLRSCQLQPQTSRSRMAHASPSLSSVSVPDPQKPCVQYQGCY